MLLDLPRFKAFVRMDYLGGSHNFYAEVYVFAVTLLESRPLLFTVHTIDGAVYSRIPIEAICTKKQPGENSIDKWGAISSSGNVVQHAYLKDYRVIMPTYKTTGRYWCTIDYDEGGFAQDPEQHKTSNIIFGDKGEIYAMPNNELWFQDDHFTDVRKMKFKDLPYRRNQTYYKK